MQGVPVTVTHLASPYGSFEDLSFQLEGGERLMVEGENGSGKTTLLRMLLGIVKPKSGTILIDGKAPNHIEPHTIGYIPQSTESVHFSLSVEEVVGLGRKTRSGEEIDEALEKVGALHLKHRSYATLSGGERQKVSLARCLLQKARLLLFDEPTASLDAASKEMVKEILSSLTLSETPTLIIVTHDQALIKMPGWKHLSV